MDDSKTQSYGRNDDVTGITSLNDDSVNFGRAPVDELLPSRTYTGNIPSGPSVPGLLLLPNELLNHIFLFLDNAPPSERRFNHLPTRDWTDSHQAPLKALSTVSRRLRAISLTLLFKHARLDPCQLTPWLDLVHRNELASSIESIVAHVSELNDGFHPAWYVRLLNEVPVLRLTVGCESHVLTGLTGIHVNLADMWAFDIPYQYLELRQDAWEATRQNSYDYLPGLLGAKHWRSLRVNEGSSLAAYTSYEYFLKKPPSLISNINDCLNTIPFDAEPEMLHETAPGASIQITLTQEMLRNLRDFSFIAVFPYYNHVDDILKCIRRMRNLENLFIKLCPDPESTALDDAVKAAKGHIDLNDPWNE